MDVTFRQMTDVEANLIISSCSDYDYSCFDDDHNEITIEKLINQDNSITFSAHGADDEVIGFVVTHFNNGVLYMAPALLDSYTGQGYGYGLVNDTIDFIQEFYEDDFIEIRVMLRHDAEKAIDLFQRVGFNVCDESQSWVEMSIEV